MTISYVFSLPFPSLLSFLFFPLRSSTSHHPLIHLHLGQMHRGRLVIMGGPLGTGQRAGVIMGGLSILRPPSKPRPSPAYDCVASVGGLVYALGLLGLGLASRGLVHVPIFLAERRSTSTQVTEEFLP